jgi:hypothetical protein
MSGNLDSHDIVIPVSEPVLHVYGKRCTEKVPLNDGSVETLAEPLATNKPQVSPSETELPGRADAKGS